MTVASQGTTVLDYNALGMLSSIQRPNGVSTTYSYDAQRYFLGSIQHENNSGQTLAQYDYTHDLVGNRLSMSDNTGLVTSWDYDSAYRLTSESRDLNGVVATSRYTYDAMGNRLSETRPTGETTRYRYNALDQITQVDYPDYQSTAYLYDVYGNLIQTEDSSRQTTNYAYNVLDQLVSTDAAGLPMSYTYDHDGRRTETNLSGFRTRYLWDEFSQYGDVLVEYGEDYSAETAYTLARGMLISQTSLETGASQYFLNDAQNSTRALAESDGTLSQSYDYDAFGNLLGDYESLETNYLYTGQQYDPTTELYSLRARYYAPNLGRFLTQDTWAYNYQNPIELNRYVYTANNPINFSDPSGNFAIGEYLTTRNVTSFITGAAAGGFGGFVGASVFVLLTQTGICGSELQEFYSVAANRDWFIFSSTMTSAVFGGISAVAFSYITLAPTVVVAGMTIPTGWVLGGMTVMQLANTFIKEGFCEGVAATAQTVSSALAARFLAYLMKVSDNNNNDPIDPPDENEIPNEPSDGGSASNEIPIVDGGGCLNSFSAETTVRTPYGDIPISELRIGDLVLAYNEETGQTGEYSITDTFSHIDAYVVHLTIDGEVIETTLEHPFYTEAGEWVNAGELEVGEEVRALDGDYGTVESVEVIETEQRMYNLTVDEVHTFAVGDGQWVVHNVCLNDAEASDLAINIAQEFSEQARRGELELPEGGGSIATVAVDKSNGKTYSALSGEIEESAVNPNVRSVLPNEPLEGTNGRPPYVCGEVGACTKALNDGANPSNLVVVSVRVNRSSHPIVAPCLNCTAWIYDFVHLVIVNEP